MLQAETHNTNDDHLEVIEREAFVDWFSAAPPETVASLGIDWTCVGTGILLAVRGIPTKAYNRAQGLGIGAPVTDTELEATIEWLRANSDPAWVIDLASGNLSGHLDDRLRARGLFPDGGFAKFQRPAVVLQNTRPTTLSVREVGKSEASDFGNVAQTAAGLPRGYASWYSALVGRAGWRMYVAYDGPVPAATGSLFAKDGWGWLAMGTTLPAYRGRGAQSTIIARRVNDGIAHGLTNFSTATREPITGEGSGESEFDSYRNMLRLGFTRAYSRIHYRPA